MKRFLAIGAAVLVSAFAGFGCSQMSSLTDSGWITLVDGTSGLDNFNPIGDANWRAQDGAIVADARVSLEDFKERTGIDLAFEDIGEDVDTLGGVVVAAVGRVPGRGEIVSHADFEFTILEADPRRVKRLRIRARQPAPAETAR